MGFDLTINGSLIDIDAADLVLSRLTAYEFRGCPQFSFVRRGGPLAGLPDPYLGKSVVLAYSATTYFTGDVVSCVPGWTDRIGWGTKYQCLGLRNRGDWVPFTDEQTGTDTSPFNVQLDNQSSDFLLSRAGRTVGQILESVLTMTQNAGALDALGIGNYTTLTPPTLPAITLADLALLTIIPPSSVYVAGERLLSAIESFCETWAPNTFFHVDPDGNLRFYNLNAFPSRTLTMGTDPIEPVALCRDVSQCFQQVEVRGQPYVIPILASTIAANGLLAERFAHDGLTNAQAKVVWKPSDFTVPAQPGSSGRATAHAAVGAGAVTSVIVDNGGFGYDPGSPPAVSFTGGGGSGATVTAVVTGTAVTGMTGLSGGSGYTSAPTVSIAPPVGGSVDTGTCTCPSTTTVTVTSDNPGTSWPSDYWDQTSTGRHGWVYLIDNVATGITQAFAAPIVANTALAPGGTSTLTLGLPLPITSYASYAIYGLAGGACNVWRQYEITNTAIGEAMTNMFQAPVPFVLASGNAALLTSYPMGSVLWSASGNPPYQEISCQFTIDPTASPPVILFSQPTYTVIGGHAPVEVRALLAVNSGLNQAYAPSSSTYEGTSATVEGLTRRLVVTVTEWRDPINNAAMVAYAQDILDSVKDAVMQGDVTYYGLYLDALTPGISINITGDDDGVTYTTGWEDNGAGPGGTSYISSFAGYPGLAVVACELDFITDGSPLLYQTIMRLSNQKGHYGAGAYLRPSRVGLVVGAGIDLAGTPYGHEAASERAAAGGEATQRGGAGTEAGTSAGEGADPFLTAALGAFGMGTDVMENIMGGGDVGLGAGMQQPDQMVRGGKAGAGARGAQGAQSGSVPFAGLSAGQQEVSAEPSDAARSMVPGSTASQVENAAQVKNPAKPGEEFGPAVVPQGLE